MKKLIYVLATIIIVSFVATVCLLKEDVKKNLEKETNQSEVSNDLNEKTEITDSIPEANDEKDNDDNLKNETTTNKIDNTIENKNANISNNSSNNDSSNITNNKTNNIQNNSTIVTDKNSSQNTEQKIEEVKTKSCTPKKFDMSFVRADFNSMAKCTETGDKYKALGYGYFCDYYQDDCGDTYYMLTLYERNTGVEFDFHNIELPN